MTKGLSQKKRNSRSADRDSAKGPKRTADEVLRDRADIARMRLEGLTQTRIAEEITRLRCYSVSQQTIANDLKAVSDEWLNQSIDNYEQTRLIELSRLDEEEKLALEGWERSTHPRKKERTRTGTNDGKPFEEFMQESENRDGNPAFIHSEARINPPTSMRHSRVQCPATIGEHQRCDRDITGRRICCPVAGGR